MLARPFTMSSARSSRRHLRSSLPCARLASAPTLVVALAAALASACGEGGPGSPDAPSTIQTSASTPAGADASSDGGGKTGTSAATGAATPGEEAGKAEAPVGTGGHGAASEAAGAGVVASADGAGLDAPNGGGASTAGAGAGSPPNGDAVAADGGGDAAAAGGVDPSLTALNEHSKRLHPAAYRDGAIQLFEAGGTLVLGFENVATAYDREGQRLALDWSELPGLTTPDSIYGQWTSVQAVGGDPRADDLAWLVARSDVERAASELFNYAKVGGRWQRVKNRDGLLAWSHRFYAARADGSILAIKEWELADDAISLEYEDDSPKARKLWAKLEKETKAHPISIEVVHVSGTSTAPAPELPVVDGVTGFTITPSGDAYATVRLTDWVDGEGEPIPRPDGMKPGAYVLRWPGATGKPIVEAVPGLESEKVADLLLAADGDTVWVWGANMGEPYRTFLARHELHAGQGGWASVEPPLSGRVGLDRVAQTADGRVWVVAGDWARREKKQPTLFTRGKDETAWTEVPLPPVSFAADGRDRIELGWDEWHVLRGTPEAASRAHFAEAIDVEAVGSELWVTARVDAVEVMSEGYSAARTVVLTTAPIAEASPLPSVSRTWLELRQREGGGDRKPGDTACRQVFALLEVLSADAAPDVDVKPTLAALKGVQDLTIPDVVDGTLREQRGVWARLVVDSPKEAKKAAQALSKALGRPVTTYCEVPVPTRVLDTID